MKKLALAFLLSLSPMAMAQEATADYRIFAVQKAEFSPEHISHYRKAHIQVDYSKNTVTLSIKRSLPCSKNKMCAMVLVRPIMIELPITAVEEKDCGIRQITAHKDSDSADSAQETIVLEDASQITCPTLRPYEGQAQYQSVYKDLETGETVTSTSTMIIQENLPSQEAQ